MRRSFYLAFGRCPVKLRVVETWPAKLWFAVAIRYQVVAAEEVAEEA
jgi:hypothetical protein